jgi:hypothetical protein
MIVPVAITGILILAAISSADQAFAYSSYHKTYYKGHHAYYKNSEYTKRHGNIPTSNTGNQAQGVSTTGNGATSQQSSNTGNAAQGASTTGEGGPSRIVVGESDGTVVLDTTKQGQTTGSNAAQGAPQSSNGNAAKTAENTGNQAQGASNVNTAQGAKNTGNQAQGASNGKLVVSNLANFSKSFSGPPLGKVNTNQLWGANFGNVLP